MEELPADEDVVVRVLALANQKGGVGKTTTAVNLSAYLATLGQRVVLIDIDPQGNATSSLGIDKESVARSIYDVLVDAVPLAGAIVPAGPAGFGVVPSTSVLRGSETELLLAALSGREQRLADAIDTLPEDAYDLVLIDCPPSLGLLTLNALTAATDVLIPIQCEFLALEGLMQLANSIYVVKRTFNRRLEILGVLMTMYDARTRLSAQVVEEVRRFFPNRIFNTVIPRGIHLAEAPSYGQSILEYEPRSRGALAYEAAAAELLARLSGATPVPTATTTDDRRDVAPASAVGG